METVDKNTNDSEKSGARMKRQRTIIREVTESEDGHHDHAEKSENTEAK